jgi:uncharacterized repeat protein (TIGR04052 family)
MHRGLLALVLAGTLQACGPADQPVSLAFTAVAHGKPISCTAGPDGMTLGDLRLYVSEIALVTADGRTVPVKIDTAAPWQDPGVALIDLEDGSGACDTGSPATHAALTGHVAADTYTGLQFVLGVPFARNHADPALAPSPLDQTAMHWHWQAGYKFLRAALRRGDDLTWLHLGSTGCEGHIGAISGCAKPNRATVKLARFDAAHDAVAIDVAALLADAPADGGNHACQSEPDNETCAPMLRHLGLAGAPQDVFHALAR